MYDADYDQYLNDLRDEAVASGVGAIGGFVVRDSGKKAQYDDGMQRDDPTGKPKFRLMWPKGVPYEEQLIYRVAMHYMHGGEKYGDRNWEKSCTEESLVAHEDALERHFHRFLEGVEDGEDHAAAVVWNINAVLLTRRNIAQKALKEEIAAAWGDEADPNEVDLGDGVTLEIDPGELKEKSYQAYVFPYIGSDTASTGKYCRKEILAENYSSARFAFNVWLSGQPFYPGALEADADPEKFEWSEGDVLEENRESLDGEPYCWVYRSASDIWLYKGPMEEPAPQSAISLNKLIETWGPLTCTKGSHVGRIVGGA